MARWRWAAADEDLAGQLAWNLHAKRGDGRASGLSRADCVAAGRAAVAVFARHGLYPGQPPVYWEPPWPPWQPRARGGVRVVRVPLPPD